MIDIGKILDSPRLPSLPTVAVQLLDLVGDPKSEIRDVVTVVKSDPALTAKILKATNSSYFGFSRKIASLERAVPLLGKTSVVGLTLSFSLSEQTVKTGPLAVHYRNFWKQSVIQAAAADMLAQFNTGAVDCDYFLAGILLDLGRLAMLKTIPDEYLPVLELAAAQRRDLCDLENELLGTNHALIGAKIMEGWNLPSSLLKAIEYHHDPIERLNIRRDEKMFDIIRTTTVAASIGDLFCSTNEGPVLERIRSLTTELYGFSEDRLMDFLSEVRPRIDEVSGVLAIDIGDLKGLLDLMAAANEHLLDLAIREQVSLTQASTHRELAELEAHKLQEKNQQLQKQTLRDSLTGVYSRQFFEESLKNEIQSCSRTATGVGVIFVDIDHFKRLNDEHGHQFGDRILRQSCVSLEKCLRKTDILARYGGEEFVVMVHRSTEKGIERIAERMRIAIEAEPFEYEGEPVHVTISIGSAFAIPRRKESDLEKRLVAASDEAMYEAKRNGRNQRFSRILTDKAESRLSKKITANRFSRWLVRREIFDVSTISQAIFRCRTAHVRIGELAVTWKLLTNDDVDQICASQNQGSDRFGETGIQMGLLTDDQVALLLALQSEDPASLSRAVVEIDLLDESEINILREQYLTELTETMAKNNELANV